MNYAAHYERLISRARSRDLILGNVNYEIHHILPRCMGGGEGRENLVSLTLEEHCVAHLLLARMYPEIVAVGYAAFRMANRGYDFTGPTNKRYACAVRRHRRRWAKSGSNYIFRKNPAKPKRFSATDVERLKKIISGRAADFS